MIWSNGANTEVNATLTHTSIGPSSASTRSAAANTASGSATSAGDDERGAAGLLDLRGGTGEALLAPRDEHDRVARGPPNAIALARPIPPLAPVTTMMRGIEIISSSRRV